MVRDMLNVDKSDDDDCDGYDQCKSHSYTQTYKRIKELNVTINDKVIVVADREHEVKMSQDQIRRIRVVVM